MELPKVLIAIGLTIVALGLVVWMAQRVPWLYSWFGHLPGDIRIEGENSRVYAPIVSMLLISIVLSVLSSLIQRFWGR